MDDLLDAALYHGLNLLTGLSRLYGRTGPSSPLMQRRGACLLKVAELEFVLGEETGCRMHLEEAAAALEATQGRQSRQARRARQLLELVDEQGEEEEDDDDDEE